ncbi:MAG: L,D-transpeptidase family protein [Lentimicrobiaceae bacterium]|nr:L,D-transpeptidase family protein [Lentimicrobiaceae bacterium]
MTVKTEMEKRNKWTRKLIILILTISCCNNGVFAQQDFLSQQKQYARVKTAVAEKEQSIAENLRKNELSIDNVHVLIVAYKAEKQLEIYAKKKTETTYKLIAVYDICASSGELGPKRRQGDRQVPEGFYKIDRFNPASSFYLSLGINYPNQSDRKKSNASNLGGDIFIHGSCVTIGCLPMTDDKIKEIYFYAILARNNGQNNIPVYIFPFRMTDNNFQIYKKQYSQNQEHIDFWTNLKSGYDKFIIEKKSLNETVDKAGNYQF